MSEATKSAIIAGSYAHMLEQYSGLIRGLSDHMRGAKKWTDQ